MSDIMRGITLFLLLLLLSKEALAECDWPAWQQYKRFYISEAGRVIDTSSAQKITTSEGQSYGMFFALVANDSETFKKLVHWTQDNLAFGDLSAHLPAWLWGQDKKQQWRILDTNSAADADLWIAYSLLEAGRLWEKRDYLTLGVQLLQRIAREEVANIPGLGPMLLPGKVGFVHGERWRLNPSYLPPQLLSRFAKYSGPWQEMQQVSQRLWLETAPQGFAPDWVIWQRDKGWQADDNNPYIGSYDAIRVYLWAGMLADDDARKPVLLNKFHPMIARISHQGIPIEKVNTENGKSIGNGPVGFSAALLPLAFGHRALQAALVKRIDDNPLAADAYYNFSLLLFGQGWAQQRYRFNRAGQLQPAWGKKCAALR